MGRARSSGIFESVGTKLKKAVKDHNLDIDMAAGRILAEGVLRYWPEGMGPAPILLKGGELFDQRVRETQDADIVTVRHYLSNEFASGIRRITSILEREGIRILTFSAAPKEIDVGYGEPVQRWIIRGTVGGVRANTSLDMTVARGPQALSRAIEVTEIPSLIDVLPPLTIAVQPLEAAAAEKLLAVALQSENDFRVRHLADVVNEDLWDGVDCRDVARELVRVCEHRGIDIDTLPETIQWPRISRLEASWEKDRLAGKTNLSIFNAWVDAAYLWNEVQDEVNLRCRPFSVQREVSNVVRMSA
ncbi:nucleotidyl transferase AbiEii/AbiGii toxin family protein [Shinella sp. S4-D37]|uniref:nucleotidyl transferase AbiEii/AbiGii toxin family protein n=1 Tax=Shinella sp. S4-D37 TaxID=3161999 RepID=UPI00346660A3